MDQDVNDNTALLHLADVTRQYGNDINVLRGVSLELAQGESLAIVGPSGCGKSTLLNIIGTLDRPSAGQITLDGEDLTAMDDEKLAYLRNQDIGFVFQEHHLLPQLSALENVLIPTLPGKTTRAHRDRAKQLLESVGLADRATHRPGELSGGERQRVAVVRALINEPKLVLADEPTGSLDEQSSDSLGDLLVSLNSDNAVTLIVVTHAATLAAKMKRTQRLHDGALVEPGDHA